MVVSDQIADMLTRIRNAGTARHDFATVPSSRTKLAIARILKEEGFVQDFEILRDKAERVIKIRLRYEKNQPFISGIERVSKPGLRIYVKHREIPRVYGGLGIAIVSTPKGIMTGHRAYQQEMGGELLCYVW
ncbi:MAG: 30S ribosomal protein S8 [Dehalococcoidia bacterium]|jgi:small subunit ribosomal protein S8|nr:MAG: 30S ribosomal protein S8 [Dehalococcoidia bacterium]